MKKLLFIASAVALTMTVACKKKKTDGPAADAFTVENTQRTLLVYNTATWCGPCGVYGGPTFKGTLDNPDIVAIDLHTSGSSLLTPIYTPGGAKKDTAMVAPFAIYLYAQTKPNGYIPHFFANNTFLGNSEVTTASITSAANTFKAAAPSAGVAVRATASGNVINIDYKAKAFSAGSGDYYLSLILCEKSVTATQSGASGGITDHKHIVRATAYGTAASPMDAFSPSAVMSNPASGQEISGSKSFTWELPALASRYNAFKRWDAFTPA
ncbi:MAG: outer membrane protein Omp28, partial [Bacteroidota bacterium]